MKVVLALALLVAVAIAAPQGADKDAHVVRLESDNIGVDGFKWAYETSNGIAAEEVGQLINAGSEKESIAVRGQYAYTGPDNVRYVVTYVADENGFQPDAPHIPKA